MADRKYLFTSESVSGGHPDKLADQVSDGVLDALLAADPMSRVACETLVTTDFCCVAGEITSKATPDYEKVVRQVISRSRLHARRHRLQRRHLRTQPSSAQPKPDIAQGVNDDAAKGKDIGAGDQGLMFGYACNDTPELMPLPIALSHRITNALTAARQKNEVSWLRPDAKSQVTIEYEGFRPVRIDTVVVSTQHDEKVTQAQIQEYVVEKIIKPLLPKELAAARSLTTSTRRASSSSAVRTATPASRGVRSSSTPTADGAVTAAALSAVRTRRRSIAAPPTWPATWRRISSRPNWPIVAKCNWPTPSASPNRSAFTSIRKARARSTTNASAKSFAKCSS